MSVHARRRAALEAFLLDLAPIWTPSPFCEARPAWCATHPALANALLALDDATLAAALREAMADKPVAQAAKAVAKRFGLDRHDVYARALALKDAG